MIDFNKVREELEDDVNEAGSVAREVLAKRASIIGVVTVLINLAVFYGWFDISISNQIQQWVSTVFDIVAVAGTVLVVRPVVTPVGSPKDSNGEALVPVSAALGQVEKAVNAAKEEYTAVRSGDLSQTPELVKQVQDAAAELVDGVKTDVAAVVAPVTAAISSPKNLDSTFGNTFTGTASPASEQGANSVSSTKPGLEQQ